MVSITKYAFPIFGILIAGLFLKEAYGSSVGTAGRSFGSGLGAFTQGISGFGESINQLGTGIGSGITGLLSPIKDVGSWFGDGWKKAECVITHLCDDNIVASNCFVQQRSNQ